MEIDSSSLALGSVGSSASASSFQAPVSSSRISTKKKEFDFDWLFRFQYYVSKEHPIFKNLIKADDPRWTVQQWEMMESSGISKKKYMFLTMDSDQEWMFISSNRKEKEKLKESSGSSNHGKRRFESIQSEREGGGMTIITNIESIREQSHYDSRTIDHSYPSLIRVLLSKVNEVRDVLRKYAFTQIQLDDTQWWNMLHKQWDTYMKILEDIMCVDVLDHSNYKDVKTVYQVIGILCAKYPQIVCKCFWEWVVVVLPFKSPLSAPISALVIENQKKMFTFGHMKDTRWFIEEIVLQMIYFFIKKRKLISLRFLDLLMLKLQEVIDKQKNIYHMMSGVPQLYFEIDPYTSSLLWRIEKFKEEIRAESSV